MHFLRQCERGTSFFTLHSDGQPADIRDQPAAPFSKNAFCQLQKPVVTKPS